jgi:hypothetical protein
MTSNRPEQPKRHGYNPITLGDVQPEKADPFFAGLETPVARALIAGLFLVVFGLSTHSVIASPFMMLILLACLLFRMTPRERAIAAAPLTFSTIRLASQIAGPFGLWCFPLSRPPAPLGAGFETGSTFVPLFLAACLFFTTAPESNTSRVAFWYSIAILLSGLLPGEGYTVICAVLYYTLFFVILVTIVTDINPRSVTRPLGPAPSPVNA